MKRERKKKSLAQEINGAEKNSTQSKLNSFVHNVKTQMISNEKITNVNFIQSIGAKLLLIIFVSIVICVSTVGIVSYQKAKELIETNVSDASAETIKQVGISVDTEFRSYVDVSFQIIFDKSIQDAMSTMITSDQVFDQFEAIRIINDRLTGYLINSNTVRGIALIPINNEISPIINGLSSSTGLQKKAEEYYNASWFTAAQEANGAAIWIEPQEDGILTTAPYESVALTRLARNVNNPELSYVMVMEFNNELLFNALDNVNFGEGSQVVIMNNDKQFAYSQNTEDYGVDPKIHIEQSSKDKLSGSETIRGTDNKSYLAVYQTLQHYDDWRILAAVPIERLEEQAAPISQITIIFCLIAGIIAIAIGIFVMRYVGAPLSQLSVQMEKGAKGDLTVRSTTKTRKDEIGNLSQSFDEMMEQIASLATQTTYSAVEVLKTATELSDTSNKTALAAKEIAVATDEIAGGATSLAVEAEKGTDLTNQINSQMVQVNQYAVQMSNSADEVDHASKQGVSYMSELIDKTATTEQMTRAMVDKVNALQDSTKSIVKILDVLNNVTKQTNILSLNATIEAARAGAAGKGFMVVADEIRQLADQSRSSIEVVAQITEKISGEIVETVDVLTEAYPMFQEQIGSVKEANQLFLSVQSQMDHFKHNMSLVTDAFDELSKSQDVLSDSMNNVSAVAEESSATSEEVASLSTEQLNISDNLVQLSEKLQQVSHSLKDSLSKFKI